METLFQIETLQIIIAIYLGSAALSLLAGWQLRDGGRGANLVAHGGAFLASALLVAFAAGVFLDGEGKSLTYPLPFPGVEFSFRIDGLSAFFLGLIGTIAALASLFGISYQKHFIGKYALGPFGFFYNLFLLGMVLTISANHGLFFLFAWELMSLASYFLVVFDRNETRNVRAGFLYLLMTQLGTIFVALALFLAYQSTGSFDFDMWRAQGMTLSVFWQSVMYAAVLIGFGTKAGIIPLHIWLPEAHPATPSHVSALMSGVMIKTAIFMIIRFFFDFFPGAPLEWGLVILVLGAISSLLGVLYALSENDIKRLLAYSSIENIGIILLGVGSALVFMNYGLQDFFVFALAAALFHTVNHAFFKSLLFLAAGSVVSATGTRNMEAYGGLIRVLPYSAFFFLIGSMAISAFPPFNGFASEWLIFQSLFVGIAASSLLVKLTFLASIASLAFTGGLAMACFAKVFGVTFLGRPRELEAEVLAHREKKSWLTHLPMAVLALLTLVLGIGAPLVVSFLVGIIASLVFGGGTDLVFPYLRFIGMSENFSGILPVHGTAIALLVFIAVLGAVVGWLTRKRTVVIAPTWDCGMPLSGKMQITSTSFSRSLMTIFSGILRPTKQTAIEYSDAETRYFTSMHSVKTDFFDVYRHYIFQPVARALGFLSDRAKQVQGGNVNVYMFYVFVTLVVLLILTAR
ncbi:MAG: hydrogenase 4 subunit B [Candidatus Moranbacteria bacterium]|nr:hydrogenase 4 subunit B [Candidatus Moranbacteria bacterium]MBP6033964.1 hydrogenase 4 subunit B [Candidatus Moranbacteria bacterium]MBP7695577.1 hydrogenase 4 subunit B [Candidatus Moranbacteria bacterium]